MIDSPDGRPLLFLDVDGPLIPFRTRPAGRGPAVRDAEASGNPLVGRLDPADGRRLLALGCELVRATTWMAEANEVVAPRPGLPRLPVADLPDDGLRCTASTPARASPMPTSPRSVAGSRCDEPRTRTGIAPARGNA